VLLVPPKLFEASAQALIIDCSSTFNRSTFNRIIQCTLESIIGYVLSTYSRLHSTERIR
jgi:hypothetical protein